MASAIAKLRKAEEAATAAREKARVELGEMVMETGAYAIPEATLKKLLQAAAHAPDDTLQRAIVMLKGTS
ncbi:MULTISPECIES: DUF6437 family protein [Alphaproteobacteria]|jgi:hypothetical protein|uniref:DUF64370 domain-containing protein n=1 Tax=Maricaulis virginensis TaxID=144022 RepID=A0A9W6IRU5_9PROT|nr:DUF6437 family protein [Maricaulis virginensis]GLK53961.1 hypothetical protein GCM10017621_34690 [Maricaulis virginensis]